MRLLLVEDDHELADWLTQSLVQRGFQIDWADDGKLAQQRALTDDFDVILLDLGLPSLSGSQLLARLKAGGNDIRVLSAGCMRVSLEIPQ